MDVATFHASLTEAAPPAGLSLALAGLWWDAKGDWGRAHGCAQDQDDAAGAAVHAYLHRKEGDAGNAAYWYRRAARPGATDLVATGLVVTGPLADEWAALVAELLG